VGGGKRGGGQEEEEEVGMVEEGLGQDEESLRDDHAYWNLSKLAGKWIQLALHLCCSRGRMSKNTGLG
jgi:hypothetical protein